MTNSLAELIDDALEARPGCVVVPVEPTKEMIEAACNEWARPGTATNRAWWAWDAMLAAPKASDAEPICESCDGEGTYDERVGGYHFSNPAAICPDCKGTGEGTTPQADPAPPPAIDSSGALQQIYTSEAGPSVDMDVLAVWDEAIRRAEAAMPTPFGLRGESAMHPAHHAGFLWDMKQARVVVADHARIVGEKDAEIERQTAIHETWIGEIGKASRRADAAEQRAEAMAGQIRALAQQWRTRTPATATDNSRILMREYCADELESLLGQSTPEGSS